MYTHIHTYIHTHIIHARRGPNLQEDAGGDSDEIRAGHPKIHARGGLDIYIYIYAVSV